MLRENNKRIEQDGNGSNALSFMRNEKNSWLQTILIVLFRCFHLETESCCV